MAAIKNEIRYTKEFLSKTDYNDKSHHGSPQWESYQTINEEDIKFRKLLLESFVLKSDINIYYWKGEGEGFDGKQQYIFRFYSEFPGIKETERDKNVNYNSGVAIKKAGALEEITKDCDLETFLLSNGFKKEKA
jgi:hypothetical protein